MRVAAAVLLVVLGLAAAADAKAPAAATKRGAAELVTTAARGVSRGRPEAGVPRGATAVIRTTEHGIPHVKARSYRGLGYGVGYAQAGDNICILADGYVTVAARRSQHFGADKAYHSGGNDIVVNNLKSDFANQRIIDLKLVETLAAKPPPEGPTAQVRALVAGFVAGYNRRLAAMGGPAGIRDPACRGAAWVRPIEAIDVYRRLYAATGLASFQYLTHALVDAAPPLGGGGAAALSPRVPTDRAALQQVLQPLKMGSNAIAVGRDGVAGGGTGMMLANPHFPWFGSERFYEFQLTLPGKLDVTGASLLGFPGVNIGRTRGVAWSHTVSTAYRFTPYELTLVPGQPTRYVVDGQIKDMTARTVKVPLADGSTREHTFYETQWGPLLHFPDAFLHWTPLLGYALADANATNFRVANTFVAMNHAQSVDELRAAEHRYQGIPWVNTIAADRDGNAYYADDSVVPNVPDALVDQCVTGVVPRAVFQLAGLPILDGSRTACAWRRDPDAVQPGIFGPSHLPRLTRGDYVTNHNDSYWLSNPAQPLTGFARIIGAERTERSLRTRLGLTMVRERLARGGFTLDALTEMSFDNRFFSGELFRDAVVGMCRSSGVDAAACDALATWDLHADLDSRGTLLWQEFMTRAVNATGGMYADSFDAARPVDTPARLNVDHPEVRQALADAVAFLKARKLAFDAPWRDVQYVQRGAERIPIHGCQGVGAAELGCFNLMAGKQRADGTLEPAVYGSSIVMATTWKGRRAVSRSILTYSQSADPTSPWNADQTRLFSRKQWVRDRFTDAEIAADPKLRVKVLREKRGA